MKINPLQQSDAISKYNNIVSPRAKSADRVSISDNLELSEGAQKFSSFLKEAKEAMDKAGRDEEIKVSDIINRIKNDTYNISADDVTDNILDSIPKNI